MITPKVPPKKPKHVYKLLIKIFLFDIIMRVTPPLSLFALYRGCSSLYKVAPQSQRKMKSAMTDIRQQLSDWIKPDEDTSSDGDEFVFREGDYPPPKEKIVDTPPPDIEFRKPN